MKIKLFIFIILSLFLIEAKGFSNENSGKVKILVGSPIRQKPAILHEFLESFKNLEKQDYTLDYFFIDDNVLVESSNELKDFSEKCGSNCLIIKPEKTVNDCQYVCNDVTHFWKDELIWKVAAFKDQMIEHALKNNYDYIFLIDSDIVLHPKTISQLKKANKDILSNIFWTAWSPGCMEQPQVWLYDEYIQHPMMPGVTLSDEQKAVAVYAFYAKLREPGTYEVGGLGACTLISKNAMQKGVNFKKISNLTFWGEDRHFCIRACAIGLSLHVDTHYPAYHIYREANLSGVPDFIKSCQSSIEKTPKLTLSMIVHNEGDRYLKPVLEHAKKYITNAVIIDDASTDNTIEVCKKALEGIPLTLIENKKSLFSNEVNLRKLQFEETIKTNPDWILVLDADEIFEDKFKDEVKELIANENADAYYFRLYDFWDENNYREDQYWSAHMSYRPFLIRYKPEIQYTWKETAQHCGRLPLNINEYPVSISHLRLKHYGWAREDDRKSKYERYQTLDPDAKYGWKEQYESILDKTPHLVKWEE